MARRGTRRSEQDEKVIDPFNAPDPIMPHDEPDLAGVYDPIVSPDEDTDDAFRPSKDRTVGTKKDTHTWHDPSYTAPTYEAPEVQETPAPKPLPRRRHRKRYANPSPVPQHRRKTANRILGLFFIIIVISQVLTIIPSCIDSISSSFSDDGEYDYTFDYAYIDPFEDLNYSYTLQPATASIDPALSWYDNETTADNLASDVLRTEIDKMAAGESPYSEQASAAFSYEFTDSCGFELDEVGLDSQTISSDITSKITYKVSSVSIYTSGDESSQAGYDVSGIIFFYANCPDVDSIAWDLASYITYDLDLEPGDEIDDKDLDLIAEEYNRLIAETPIRECFVTADVSGEVIPGGSNLTLSLNETTWDDTVRTIFGA